MSQQRGEKQAEISRFYKILLLAVTELYVPNFQPLDVRNGPEPHQMGAWIGGQVSVSSYRKLAI